MTNPDNTSCIDKPLPPVPEPVPVNTTGITAASGVIEYSSYNTINLVATVQFVGSMVNVNTDIFTYKIIEKIDGKIHDCPKCKAFKDANHFRVLKFKFDSDVRIISGQAIVTYPVSKTSTRILQDSLEVGKLVFDDIYLPGNDTTEKNNDRDTYRAEIAFDAIRILALLVFIYLMITQAFLPTYLFSWLQIWSVIGGPFLVYPDRFLKWHRDWHILVIDFGDPFSTFVDWNTVGGVCAAGKYYPLNQLGCSITQNFGQNFIVILFIMIFCLIVGGILALMSRMTSLKSEANSPVPPQLKKKEKARVGFSYGVITFMRFMQAFQPSLILFSIMQFYTHKASAKMSLGVFLSFMFLSYFVAMQAMTGLAVKRLIVHLKPSEDEEEAVMSVYDVAMNLDGWTKIFAFQFSDTRKGFRYVHLAAPAVEFIRILLVSVFAVTLEYNVKASLGLILTIELLRFGYQAALFKSKTRLFYYIVETIFSFLFVLFVILKIGSNNITITETTRQVNVGVTISLIITQIGRAHV